VRVQVTARLLKLATLPANPPYGETHLATLYQEDSGDVISVVCDEACVGALKLTPSDTPITVEASARQIDLSTLGGRGKAYRLRLLAVSGVPGEAP
jgi:hypothetical protein